MRFRCAAYVLLVALAACGSSSAASGGSSSGTGATACGQSAAQTVAAGRLARVYVVHGEVYGCAVGRHRSFRLGASSRSIRSQRVGPVAVAGENAAYGLTSFGVDTVSALLIVRNLADGQQLHMAPASDRVLPESFQSVESIVVDARGAVAWISRTSSVIGRATAVFQVWRIDSRGQSLLDSGRSIDGSSLRRSGTLLTWRDGSRIRSATLR